MIRDSDLDDGRQHRLSRCNFHGSQMQPNVRTVQGEIKGILEKLRWWSESCLEMSSRTDSGVQRKDEFGNNFASKENWENHR